MSGRSQRRGVVAAVLAAAGLTAGALAGCGSTSARTAALSQSPPVRLSLATSADYPDGSWAVLVMGGSAAEHNNFWQVFVRTAKSGTWRLATPLGVASNGGITVAAEGGAALAAAIRPSQDLSFSPLASSSDNGAKWAQSGLLDARLASAPAALASAPGGRLLALTRTGNVERSVHPGAAWSTLASEHTLARAAGAGCRAVRVHLGRATARPASRSWQAAAPAGGRPRSSGWRAAAGPAPGPRFPQRWAARTSRSSRWPVPLTGSRRC